jgi:hypothetical protein
MKKINLFTTGNISLINELTPDQRIFLIFQNKVSVHIILSLFKTFKKISKVRKNIHRNKQLKSILLNSINFIVFKNSPMLGISFFILQNSKKTKNNILMGGMYWSNIIDEYGNKKTKYHIKQILIGIVLPVLFSTVLYALCQNEKRLHVISPLRITVLPPLPPVYEVVCDNIGTFNSLLVHLNSEQKYGVSNLRYKAFVLRLCLEQMFDIRNYTQETINFMTTREGGNLCFYRADLLDYLIDKTCQANPILDKVCFDMVRYLAQNYRPKVF